MLCLRFLAPPWAREECVDANGEDDLQTFGREMLQVVSYCDDGDDDDPCTDCRIWCRGPPSSCRDETSDDVVLSTFGVSCEIRLGRRRIDWRNARRVSIRVPSPGFVQAFVVALNDDDDTIPFDVTHRNAFAIAAAGVALKISSVEAAAARLVALGLTEKSLPRAVEYAVDRGNHDMLRACYASFKEHCLSINAIVFESLAADEARLKTPFFGERDDEATFDEDDDDLAVSLTISKREHHHSVPSNKTTFSPRLRRCYLVRRRYEHEDEFGLYDDFSLKLLCSARARKGASNFLLATSLGKKITKHRPNYLGELNAADLARSHFILRDWGLEGAALPDLQRRVRAAITYETNVLGRCPNSMRVALLLGHERATFSTRKAKWNEKLQMFTLEFQGRVTRASKKNFQLVQDDVDCHPQVLLLFGKISKNRFSLDFAPPFKPAVALATALTTFASKLAAA